MDTENIILQTTEVICGRHGEVFKARWPLGYPAFSITAFQAVLEQPEFREAVNKLMDDPAIPDVTTFPAAVHYLLATVPLCCRLGPDGLLAVYNEINNTHNVWSRRHCVICGRQRAGGPYRRSPTNPLKYTMGAFKHVCLRCVTHGQDGR